MSDLEGCKPELPENVTCPDGSALPMTDADGNGILTPADCATPSVEETPATVVVVDETPAPTEPEVAATNVETPKVEVPAPVEPPASVLATDVVVVEQPAAPAEVAALRAAPSIPVRQTAVLGLELERGSAPLARTGAGDVGGQLAVALTLLALGFGLVRLGRRPAATLG
jgi:hypothetical protein